MSQECVENSQFFVSASHDLKQHVHAIGLFLDPLIRGYGQVQDPVVVRSLKGISQSCQVLDEMLTRILDLARIEAGTLQPIFESVNVDEVLQDLVLQYSAIAESSGVRLVVFSKADRFVVADKLMLRRVISNLLDNAIKFSRSGQTVVLASRFVKDGWSIQVRDAGPGIPEAAIDCVFEAFVQSCGVGGGEKGGYGLGLAIARNFVLQMNGAFNVRTKQGHGCCMSVVLPRPQFC